jgi:hypothetical protein
MDTNNSCLGSSSSSCHELQKEEMWTHQPTPTKEEAKVIYSLGWRLAGMEIWDGDELDLVAWLAVLLPDIMIQIIHANAH